MSHLTKRIFAIAAAVTLLASLSLPAAAHGGRHGGRHTSSTSVSYCTSCGISHSSGAHVSGGHHSGSHH